MTGQGSTERKALERDILRELVWAPALLEPLVPELPAAAFWFLPHRKLYDRLLGYRQAGREWSRSLILSETAESDRAFHLEVINLAAGRFEEGGHSLSQLLEMARELCRVATAGKVRSLAESAAADPEHAEAHAQAILEATRNGTSPTGWERLALPAPAFLERSYAVPPSLLHNGMLARGDLAILYGKPGLGKSWLALAHAVACASGQPWLGLAGPPAPLRAAFVSLEIPAHRLQARLAVLCGDEPPATLFLLSRPDLQGTVNILDSECYRRLERMCSSLALDLLILDAMSRTHQADENDPQVGAELMARCKALGDNGGPAVELVHHERKSPAQGNGSEDDLDALRGSSRLISDPTLLMRLKRHGNLLKLVCSKSNNGPEFDDIWLASSEHGAPVVIEPPKEKAARHSTEVTEALKRRGGTATAEQLAGDTGMSSRTVRRHLEAAGAVKIGSTRGAVYRTLDNLDKDISPDVELFGA